MILFVVPIAFTGLAAPGPISSQTHIQPGRHIRRGYEQLMLLLRDCMDVGQLLMLKRMESSLDIIVFLVRESRDSATFTRCWILSILPLEA